MNLFHEHKTMTPDSVDHTVGKTKEVILTHFSPITYLISDIYLFSGQ